MEAAILQASWSWLSGFIPECPSLVWSSLQQTQKVTLSIPSSVLPPSRKQLLQASGHFAIHPQVGYPLTHSSILFTIVGIEAGCGQREAR